MFDPAIAKIRGRHYTPPPEPEPEPEEPPPAVQPMGVGSAFAMLELGAGVAYQDEILAQEKAEQLHQQRLNVMRRRFVGALHLLVYGGAGAAAIAGIFILLSAILDDDAEPSILQQTPPQPVVEAPAPTSTSVVIAPTPKPAVATATTEAPRVANIKGSFDLGVIATGRTVRTNLHEAAIPLAGGTIEGKALVELNNEVGHNSNIAGPKSPEWLACVTVIEIGSTLKGVSYNAEAGTISGAIEWYGKEVDGTNCLQYAPPSYRGNGFIPTTRQGTLEATFDGKTLSGTIRVGTDSLSFNGTVQ